MSEYLIQDTSLNNIASSIHAVNGETSAYSPADMKAKIDGIGDEVDVQANIIAQIQTALNNKAAPSITVASSGLITAGDSTHQLSSSDDPDFIAENIAKDVTIFGVTGVHSGGSGGLPTVPITISYSSLMPPVSIYYTNAQGDIATYSAAGTGSATINIAQNTIIAAYNVATFAAATITPNDSQLQGHVKGARLVTASDATVSLTVAM